MLSLPHQCLSHPRQCRSLVISWTGFSLFSPQSSKTWSCLSRAEPKIICDTYMVGWLVGWLVLVGWSGRRGVRVISRVRVGQTSFLVLVVSRLWFCFQGCGTVGIWVENINMTLIVNLILTLNPNLSHPQSPLSHHLVTT